MRGGAANNKIKRPQLIFEASAGLELVLCVQLEHAKRLGITSVWLWQRYSQHQVNMDD